MGQPPSIESLMALVAIVFVMYRISFWRETYQKRQERKARAKEASNA